MLRFIKIFLFSLCVALPAAAQDVRYISDEVFVVLHTGPGKEYRWAGKLKPGARLDVARTSGDGKWAEVTTSRGTTGWVTTEFLTATAPAQVKLPAAEARAEQLSTKNKQLSAQLSALQTEKSQLASKANTTGSELDSVSRELADLKKISGKAVKLDTDNRRLVQETEHLRSEVDMLEAENARLGDKLESEDFLNGALAVLLGVIITLVVPRLWPKRRKSSSWA
ncbi:TIGR04211 family SH3 domain-containing protein [Pseudohalioglobus lutimaris]|uniref:TIGR04211 family SH3 domain-containing protein n=1 Tax=Pseudohalioglobus lutimaris TaxID=1737061 RepID=A0A2N5X5I1_9GAMM|nr:TIGR04211 family SH3 domain-containing protein [Pseudohalioglobus lutimaris]PLW69749.1 TIGR04211 family SH3 domain-containing protein [Pseudohalioglobus lutimaris]